MNDWAVRSLLHPGLSPAREVETREARTIRPAPQKWDPEAFARKQIRGLVQQVFLSNPDNRIRHVVFSSTEPEADIRGICRSVGEELALENMGSVAVVGRFPHVCSNQEQDQLNSPSDRCLRAIATPAGSNLWLVPEFPNVSGISAAKLRSRSSDLRREFDFALMTASLASDSQIAAAMAQLTDGVVLVVSARYTHRATAIRIKRALESAQARVLGVVLSDRTFPIPERMYRRL